RRIDFVQDRHRAVANAGTNQKNRHVSAAQIGKLLTLIEKIRHATIVGGEEVGQRQREYVEDLVERGDRWTDSVLLDLGNQPVGYAVVFGERALRQTRVQTRVLEARADIDLHGRRPA